MIIYDENLKISAITQDSLELLGFDSLDDFLLQYKDISELVITSQESPNYSFLEFLQNTKDNSARVNLKRKDGGAILLEARLQNAILKNGEKFFIVLLEKQDIINNQNLIAAVKVKPTLRLPVFKLNAWYLFDTQTQSLIDDSWFETSLKILNLNKKDFAWILKNYLLGNFDNIEEQKQFDTWANRAWLKLNLNEEQQKIWLSKNKETFFYEKGEQSKEKVGKIIIEKELDPLNILMMWNRVNWSCFSFYSPWKNFAYAVANAVDVNKWVFFIKNEKWNLIWRTCITIWKNKNLVNYKIYKTWLWENLELDYIFAEYLAILSKKMKMMISSKKVPTDTIECKKSYFDL